jgi:3-isopropylmalate dehydrogenase
LSDGARTADLAEPGIKPISTQEMGDAVLEALDASAASERDDD